ncbi:hypothetical protein K7G98_03310 [Saccharothrix sp. MB29]|nr:hypothetical protein [Saccharothrix sp. MB29]
MLQRLFDSINNRDYELWTKAVTAERVATLSRQKWLDDTGSADGSILVHRIEVVGPTRLRVLMTSPARRTWRTRPPTSSRTASSGAWSTRWSWSAARGASTWAPRALVPVRGLLTPDPALARRWGRPDVSAPSTPARG